MADSPDRTFTIQEEISHGILPVQEAKFRTPQEAILELIDNPLDEFVAARIVVRLNFGNDVFSVEDEWGRGMNKDDLKNWAKWGHSGKRTIAQAALGEKGFIGRHGIGGKAAIHFLTREYFTVTSIRSGETTEYTITSPKLGDRQSLYEFSGTQREYSRAQHGVVRIEMHGMNHKINQGILPEFLGKVYAPAIEKSRISIRLENRLLNKEVPPILPAFDGDPLNVSFSLANGVNITGEVGIVDENKSKFKPGIAIYELDRLIKEGWLPGAEDISNAPDLRKLTGRILIDSSRVAVDITKSEFLQTEDWELLKLGVIDQIGPVLAQLKSEAELERLPDKRHALAFKLADRIIRACASDIGVTVGIKPPERNGEYLPNPRTGPKNPGQRAPYLPQTPAPEGAVGRRTRLGASFFAAVERQQLGSKTRLQIKFNEDGNPILVIGTNYKGFTIADKHNELFPYILQTLARGISTVQSYRKEITPEEALDKADEYYALFISNAEKDKDVKRTRLL